MRNFNIPIIAAAAMERGFGPKNHMAADHPQAATDPRIKRPGGGSTCVAKTWVSPSAPIGSHRLFHRFVTTLANHSSSSSLMTKGGTTSICYSARTVSLFLLDEHPVFPQLVMTRPTTSAGAGVFLCLSLTSSIPAINPKKRMSPTKGLFPAAREAAAAFLPARGTLHQPPLLHQLQRLD